MNASWLAFSEMIVSIEVLFCACYTTNIFHLKLSDNNGFSQGLATSQLSFLPDPFLNADLLQAVDN